MEIIFKYTPNTTEARYNYAQYQFNDSTNLAFDFSHVSKFLRADTEVMRTSE